MMPKTAALPDGSTQNRLPFPLRTTEPQYRKIREYIEIGRQEGAEVLFGGGTPAGPEILGSQFVEPTIFANVRNDMRIAQEEIFGPVLSVIGFDTEEEAVEIGNDIAFGLAAPFAVSSDQGDHPHGQGGSVVMGGQQRRELLLQRARECAAPSDPS